MTRSEYRIDRAEPGTLIEGIRRLDQSVALRAPVRTDEGFLVADAFIAKPGVMEYQTADGRTVLELVPRETLHDPAALVTLANKPVTLDHPPVPVTPANFARYAVGHVTSEAVVADDGHVRFGIVVSDAKAIAAIEGGKAEVSPGYLVDIENTAGTDAEFGPFDRIQRRRRYNHLAIVDEARGGPSVRLRADGHAELVTFRNDGATMDRDKLTAALADLTGRTRADCASALDTLQRTDDTLGDLLAKVNDAEGAVAKLTKANEGLQSQVDAFELFKKKGESEEGKADAKAASLVLVDETIALRALAVTHAVEGEIAKMDAAELRAAIVDKAVEIPEGIERSDSFDRAAIAILGATAKAAPAKPSAWAGLAQAGTDKPSSKRTVYDALLNLDSRDAMRPATTPTA